MQHNATLFANIKTSLILEKCKFSHYFCTLQPYEFQYICSMGNYLFNWLFFLKLYRIFHEQTWPCRIRVPLRWSRKAARSGGALKPPLFLKIPTYISSLSLRRRRRVLLVRRRPRIATLLKEPYIHLCKSTAELHRAAAPRTCTQNKTSSMNPVRLAARAPNIAIQIAYNQRVKVSWNVRCSHRTTESQSKYY